MKHPFVLQWGEDDDISWEHIAIGALAAVGAGAAIGGAGVLAIGLAAGGTGGAAFVGYRPRRAARSR